MAAEEVVNSFFICHANHITARNYEFDFPQLVFFEFELCEVVEDGGDAHKDVDFIFRNIAFEFLGIELGDQERTCAVKQWHMDTAAETEGVEIRQESHERKICFEELRDEIFGAKSLGIEIEVTQDDAFGLARGAARVHDSGGIFGIDAGMRIADEFIGLQKEFIPGNDVLGFLDMILAAFGEFINTTDNESHGACR